MSVKDPFSIEGVILVQHVSYEPLNTHKQVDFSLCYFSLATSALGNRQLGSRLLRGNDCRCPWPLVR